MYNVVIMFTLVYNVYQCTNQSTILAWAHYAQHRWIYKLPISHWNIQIAWYAIKRFKFGTSDHAEVNDKQIYQLISVCSMQCQIWACSRGPKVTYVPVLQTRHYYIRPITTCVNRLCVAMLARIRIFFLQYFDDNIIWPLNRLDYNICL